jgi:tetratricopeptide (TPR) repeat protein
MTRLRVLFFVTAWCCITVAAAAQPTETSVQPAGKSEAMPGNDDDAQKVGSLFLHMCVDHFGRGEFTWAEQACSQALVANPREVDAYKLRGYIYLVGHRFVEAAADFRAALRLRPSDDQVIAGYGQSLSGMGKFPAAEAQFRKALAMSPQRAPYWNGLCWALAGDGQKLQEALSSCNHALSLMPGAAGTLNSRAMVYLRMKRFPLAIMDYSASLDVQQDQASAWFGRGLAHLNLGKLEGASDILEARRRDPGIDGLFVQMGVLPANCSQATGGKANTKSACPPGFPLVQSDRSGAYMAVSLHADPDQELASAMQAFERGLKRK